MRISSHTTEGRPSECPVCGKKVWTTPSCSTGDATCPHCGSLLWFDIASTEVDDPIRQLAVLGAEVEVDDEGVVQVIRFSGRKYDDSIIHHLAKLVAVPVIDIRETGITKAGLERLRALLPNATIRY